MRKPIVALIVETVFGWLWLFGMFSAKAVVTLAAAALAYWIFRSSKKTAALENKEIHFKTRSFRLIAGGEFAAIAAAVLVLNAEHLQGFTVSVIAAIVGIHFVLLGQSMKKQSYSWMGWTMAAAALAADIIFTPMAAATTTENWTMIGATMGLLLWGNVVRALLMAARIRSV